jgi:hypothetical protein
MPGTAAASEWDLHLGKPNSWNTVESLWAGLSTLRKLFLTRLHHDVESHFGADPIHPPLTHNEAYREIHHASDEIDIYSLTVVLGEVSQGGYVQSEPTWLRDWLIRLRWGDAAPTIVDGRMQVYDQYDKAGRRHLFASLLERALPEATRAPLVIYRLYPLSVRIVTALAFEDRLRAHEIRNEQTALLSAIADCHVCHGRPLDNGEVCRECGNPLWKINWLCVSD